MFPSASYESNECKIKKMHTINMYNIGYNWKRFILSLITQRSECSQLVYELKTKFENKTVRQYIGITHKRLF